MSVCRKCKIFYTIILLLTMIAVIIAKIEWVLQNNQNIATWLGTIGTWVELDR
jgi:hypothetical protein